MANLRISSKRLQIDKASQSVLIITSVAVFITIFSIFVCRSLLIKRAYQAKVVAGKETAHKQLQKNLKSVDQLNASYQAFVEAPTNVIGGSATGQGDRDGDNARIVLDALPSKYDFPALATSLDKLLKGYGLESISGSDDEINQSSGAVGQEPIPIPFNVTVAGDFTSTRNMLIATERSIRPIQINTLNLSGADNRLQVQISATTYYQPETKLEITKKDVK